MKKYIAVFCISLLYSSSSCDKTNKNADDGSKSQPDSSIDVKRQKKSYCCFPSLISNCFGRNVTLEEIKDEEIEIKITQPTNIVLPYEVPITLEICQKFFGKDYSWLKNFIESANSHIQDKMKIRQYIIMVSIKTNNFKNYNLENDCFENGGLLNIQTQKDKEFLNEISRKLMDKDNNNIDNQICDDSFICKNNPRLFASFAIYFKEKTEGCINNEMLIKTLFSCYNFDQEIFLNLIEKELEGYKSGFSRLLKIENEEESLNNGNVPMI